MRTRSPICSMVPATIESTFNSRPICGSAFRTPLYRITDVRDTTRSALILARFVMSAAVIPSARYPLSAPAERLSSGSTASDPILVDSLGAASSGVLIAMVQIAVYDAVVSITGGYEPYAFSIRASPHASVPAAVAQSAHDVLVDLLPAQAAALDSRLGNTLASIPDGDAKSTGVWVGSQAAGAILAQRADDGRFVNVPYTFLPPGPGVYQPTPPRSRRARSFRGLPRSGRS